MDAPSARRAGDIAVADRRRARLRGRQITSDLAKPGVDLGIPEELANVNDRGRPARQTLAAGRGLSEPGLGELVWRGRLGFERRGRYVPFRIYRHGRRVHPQLLQ